jgi:hypothetical protein
VKTRLKVGIAIAITVVVLSTAAVVAKSMFFTPPGIPHTVNGRGDCLSCHGQNAVKPYPDWHDKDGYDNSDCTSCHHVGS